MRSKEARQAKKDACPISDDEIGPIYSAAGVHMQISDEGLLTRALASLGVLAGTVIAGVTLRSGGKQKGRVSYIRRRNRSDILSSWPAYAAGGCICRSVMKDYLARTSKYWRFSRHCSRRCDSTKWWQAK